MGLKQLIVRRIIHAVPATIGALTILFAVLQLLSPVMRLSLFIQTPRDMRPENIRSLIHEHGLDQPIPVQ